MMYETDSSELLAMVFLLCLNAMSFAEEKTDGGMVTETTETEAEMKSEPTDEPKAEMKAEEKDDEGRKEDRKGMAARSKFFKVHQAIAGPLGFTQCAGWRFSHRPGIGPN
jgi:hypothetical protein